MICARSEQSSVDAGETRTGKNVHEQGHTKCKAAADVMRANQGLVLGLGSGLELG